MFQIKLNLETVYNCGHPLRIHQSLYREHQICELNILDFMSTNMIPFLNLKMLQILCNQHL